MKILVASMSYRPNVSGVAVFVDLLIQHLEKSGHEIILVVPARRMRTSKEIISPTLTRYNLRSFSNPLRSGFFLPFRVRRIVNDIIETTKPDIVHVNDPMAMSRYVQDAASEQGIPVIVSNHFMLDYILVYLPKFIRNWTRPFFRGWVVKFYNRCDAVVAPSQMVAVALEKMGVTKPVVTLSNGVDIHRFFSYFPLAETRANLGLGQVSTILYVGRVDKDKSVDVLINAFSKVRQKTPCQLLIVGDGNELGHIKKRFEDLIQAKALFFTGQIDHQSGDLVAVYELADVFVMPSNIETQSISTMEAMASSKPVIAANGGALPELVKHEQNGLLFKPGDVEDLTISLERLINNPQLCHDYGAKGLELVAKHELDISLGLFENLYSDSLARHKNSQ